MPGIIERVNALKEALQGTVSAGGASQNTAL